MKNSINSKWTLDLIKYKVKILEDNEVYRIGDILLCDCYNHKNSIFHRCKVLHQILKSMFK